MRSYYRRGNSHVCVVVCVELRVSWNYCYRGIRHVCVVVSAELLLLGVIVVVELSMRVCICMGGTVGVVGILLSWN